MRGLTTDQWIVWIASCAFLIVAAGCTSTRYVTKQAHHENAFLGVTNPVWYSPSQPELSERTQSLLVRYDLLKQYKSSPEDALIKLQTQDLKNPQQLYAIAELAYLQGYKARKSGRKGLALQHYGTALMASYRYLLGPELADQRNVFDPQFRRAADLYNEALEDSLRLMSAELKENNEFLRPGESYDLSNGAHKLKMRVLTQGTARQKWRSEDFGGFEFVSDYRIEQLRNRHTTYGLGVPLIVVNQRSQSNEQVCKYYPEGLSFAVTALVRCPPKQQLPAGEDPALIGEAGPRPDLATSVSPNANEITLELYDPLSENEVRLHERWVPLQTDISTPLAFFLDSEQFRKKNMPTEGLLRPDSRQEARGLFMLEPYDPNRIPVLMVHGLWSSPLTWMDMFNDLRSFPEIRERYQFWFYLYPTGQPFWISAVQLRTDLQDMQRQLDPESRNTQLNQMVLVGHSMGGLVSRLQTIDSGDDFWKIVSDKPIAELKGDDEDRMKLASALYFKPNQSIQRVITIGTPHRGSDFANDYTRWLGRQFIRLPRFVRDMGTRLNSQNPGFFKDTELITTTTSIDSLAPESPIFPVMLRARKAAWVKNHNIVGVVSDERFIDRFSDRGDRVVSYESAHLEPDQVISEKVVAADHQTIHATPEAILEVRRILLEHLREIDYTGRVAQSPLAPQIASPEGLSARYSQNVPQGFAPSQVVPASATSTIEGEDRGFAIQGFSDQLMPSGSVPSATAP